MSPDFTIYGIAVTPKTGGEPVDERFPSRAQRDEFLAWYRKHGRECKAVSRVDQAAIDRAEKIKADDAHRRAVEIARAGRSVYHGGSTYQSFSSGAGAGLSAGVGLALGVALGGLF